MSAPEPPPIIGIDLGTSTCLAYVALDSGLVSIRPDHYFVKEGEELVYADVLMPSAFCDRDGEILVGHRALNELSNPRYADDVIVSVKRFMRHAETKHWPSGGRHYSPLRITGEFVKALVRAAEKQLKLPAHTIEEAVVTVPVDFGSTEMEATKRACKEIGGLKRVTLVDEPVAAAYALGLHEQPGDSLVLVVDLGGGTFDATLLRAGRDVPEPMGFLILGRDGDTGLGGQNWDREIADWAARTALPDATEDELSLLIDGREKGRTNNFGNNNLYRDSQRAKHVFFDLGKTGTPPALQVRFRRATEGKLSRQIDAVVPGRLFLERNEPLVEECASICERLFKSVSAAQGKKIGWSSLKHIYMAGGGSRMWTVRQRLRERSNLVPELNDDDCQYAIARGAALCGRDKRLGKPISVLGRKLYRHSIGLRVLVDAETRESKFRELIGKNTPIPFEKTFGFPVVIRDPDSPMLNVRIVEERHERHATRLQPIKKVAIPALSVNGNGRAESVRIVVACDQHGALSFRVGENTIDVEALRRESEKGTRSDGG